MSVRDHAPTQIAWFDCMRRGDFESAWRISDAMMHERRDACCVGWPRHEQYIWNGQSLENKRVLVRCYHGLGDTIQFIRYIPVLRKIASRVLVWAQPELLGLLAGVEEIDQLLPLHDGEPDVEFDADIECMELQHYFRTTVTTIPQRVPYLNVPAAKIGDGDRLSVGLIWKSGNWDRARTIPTEKIARVVAACPRIDWHILQQGEDGRVLVGHGCRASGTADIRELAAIMRGLDLVISVDSMPAHLAGALGVPVWTLLRRHADWRWMENRDDTPWYPTMRLYRQEREGDWDAPLERICADLHAPVICKSDSVTTMRRCPRRRSRLLKSSPPGTPSV